MRVSFYQNRWIVRLLVISMLVQSYAVIAMPFCQHTLPAHAMVQDTLSHNASHHTHSQHHPHSKPSLNCFSTHCLSCGFCGIYNIPALLLSLRLDLEITVSPFFAVHFYLFTPDPPQRPPQFPLV
jgi:hypothetical protein